MNAKSSGMRRARADEEELGFHGRLGFTEEREESKGRLSSLRSLCDLP
jgi:hypothetical protein